MPLAAPRRTTLSQQVAAQLTALIESGEWPVGSKIPPEPQLIADLGVGRNTVRESIRGLVHAGLLEPRPGDGTYVRARSVLGAVVGRRLSAADAVHALEVREGVERTAARLAASRRTRTDLTALRSAARRRAYARDARDVEAFVAADLELHQAVAAASHNPVLIELYASVAGAVAGSISETSRDWARMPIHSHDDLVDAIEQRDPDAAERAVTAYIARATASLATTR